MKYNKSFKSPSQMDAYNSVRKAGLPQNQIERPSKGGGYKRREKFRRDWTASED